MSDRSVVVRLKAEVAGFKSGMEQAAASVKATKKETEDAGKATEDASKRSVAEISKVAKAHQDAAAAVGLHYDATGKLVTANDKAVTSQQAAAHGLQAFSSEAYLAGKATEDAGNKTSGAMSRMQGSSERNREAWGRSGEAMLGFGAAAVGGVALAVNAFAEFDAKMSQVQSLSHASKGDMETLTTAALTAGSKIGFSATEVADAEIELVKAGASVTDMMGGALVGALSLAAAGQIDVGKATEIATIAMTQFKLSGKDIPHVADLLAAGADKALGGVQELGDGLKQGGLVASQFGLTIDDTVGTLSAFANAGLLGSDAGTSMKTMFLALASPSSAAQKALDKYNITAYDSEGKFKGVTELAGQLHDKLGNLSDAQRNAALSTIFGTDAMRSASVLMNEGRDGIAKWISDVNDQGFAAQQAAGKMDNMNGDLKKLGASFQTGLIEIGQSADGFLRPLIQGITGAVQAFNQLPQPMKGFGLAAAATAGGVSLLVGGFLMLAPRVFDTINGFKNLANDMPRVSSALGAIGKAAGIAAAAFIGLQVAAAVFTEKETKSAEEYGQALIAVSKAVEGVKGSGLDSIFGNYDKEFGVAVSNIGNLSDAVHRLANQDDSDGITKAWQGMTNLIGLPKGEIGQLEDRLKGLGDAMGNLVRNGGADTAAKSFRDLSSEFEKNGKSAEDALNYLPGYRDALMEQANAAKYTFTSNKELVDFALGKVPGAMKDAASATQGAAGAAQTYATAASGTISVSKEQQKELEKVGLAADGTKLSMDKLVQSLISAGMMQLSADDAARAYEAALDALTASIGKNGKTLDITTAAGRENSAAYDAIAKAGLTSADAMAKNGSSQQEIQAHLTATYGDLVTAAGAFGITGDAADTMARKALGVPKNVDIKSWLEDHASAQIDAVVGKARAADGTKVSIGIYTTEYFQTVDKRSAPTTVDPNQLGGHYATGGYISGGMGSLRAYADGGHVGGFASAGYIQGPGSGTSDSILARLSNGEFVMRAAMVQKYGLGFMDSLNKGSFAPGKASQAPTQQAAPQSYAAAQQSGAKVEATHNYYIYEQSNPVATAHEVARRQSALSI